MTELTTEPGPDAPRRAKAIPGQPDMWMFVLFEALIFTAYLSVYLFYRAQSPSAFLAAQAQLNLPIGIFNTVVLLTSSWSVAYCVDTARAGSYRQSLRAAWLTVALGAVFVVSKGFEWIYQIELGKTISSSDFFTYYFFLTGIHCLHVLIGFVVMGIAIYHITGPQRRSQELIETCATYWHTVDFLWVLIFAMIYVVR